MPLDPSISLGVQVPQPTGALGGTAMLGGLNTLSELMLRLNQNALFQQQWQANHQAGQIMASAPDMETGIQNLLHSEAAPYMGPFLQNLRAMDKTMLDMSIAKSGAAQGVLGTYLKSLSGAYADQSMIPGLRAAALATAPKESLAQATGAIDSINTALLDGIEPMVKSGDPKQLAQAGQAFRTRVIGMLAGNGVGADTLRAMSGLMAPGFQTITGPQGQQMPGTVGGSIFNPGANQFQPLVPAGASQGEPNALGGSPMVPGGAASLVGPGATQRSYLENRGKAMNQYQEELDADVTSGYHIQQTTQEALQALKDFRPGAGADVYRRLGQFAQAVGASQQTVDKISNGNLAATQEFQKLMVNNVMAQIRSQLPSGSRLAQYEFRVFEDRNPNIETDPRAIQKIFGFWNKLYERARDEQDSMNSYLGSPGANISLWPAMWQKMAKDKGYTSLIVDQLAKDQGGNSGAPSGAPSPSPAASHRWVPGQGLVPINP